MTHISDPIVDSNNTVYAYNDNNAGYGIVIKPEKKEQLCAIGYFSMTTGVNDTVRIYRIPDDLRDADYYYTDELGEPVSSFECRSITGGYHSFSLTQPLDILETEEYLVTVIPGKASKLVYEKAMDVTTDNFKDDWQHDLGAIHTVNTASGMSCLMSEEGDAFIRQTDKDFFVKAYTKDK